MNTRDGAVSLDTRTPYQVVDICTVGARLIQLLRQDNREVNTRDGAVSLDTRTPYQVVDICTVGARLIQLHSAHFP